ncbi:CLUMA_CG010330, isoform A [Clunio marinus]|uniref:Transporter n=1 Tax=Clunio marinus TaxID=568069 RepID=A0A1J1I9Q8_9DIPT|nr:CLUMA_CG010330, isoform A [Clunio marinus]
MEGIYNQAFSSEENGQEVNNNNFNQDVEKDVTKPSYQEREKWGKDIEFLFSCIALSVGLGNIWRFPFVALANGGGAFVIPYIIVLVLVGRPVYFLEMMLGQFSNKNSVTVYNCVPAFRGVGVGQVFATSVVLTYYSSIMAITLRYLFDSFRSELPWSVCRPEWENCIPANIEISENTTWSSDARSSAELYFLKVVIQARDNILDGIGWPVWNLVGFLALSWFVVFLVLIKGVKSAGKASYVLAIFPYTILLILLIRSLTLPGAFKGIEYFFTPQWEKIIQPSVWYAAVTQVFFSLNIFFGSIVMYASYNRFDNKLYRDVNIVTSLDTFTSLLAGCTIFGIIGHLAHELGVEDVSTVIAPGPGLAFISYPLAISRFTLFPNGFSAIFFIMLYVLGVGTSVAMTSVITTIIKDHCPKIKIWQAVLIVAVVGTIVGSVYLTPGGQSVLELVDFYGSTLIAFILANAQLVGFCYIYGVNRLLNDVNFMLGYYPNFFWKICWRFITPILMTAIAIYFFIFFEIPTDGNYEFPAVAHAIGWCLTAIGLIPFPIFAFYRIYFRKENTWWEKIKSAFRPTESWGPRDPVLLKKYKESL